MTATVLTRGRRAAVVAVAMVALAAGLAPTAQAGPPGGGGDARSAVATLAPDGRMLLGIVPDGGGNARQAGVESVEADIGRHVDYVRVFEQWESTYPTAFHTWLTGSDRIMALSVRAKYRNGTAIPWHDIATMAPGSALDNQLQTWITRMMAIDGEVWFTFHHEPEISASIANGTAADYIAAWRRVVTEFRNRGATNVKFLWIVTGYSLELPPSDRRYGPDWYPGDAYVDMLATDTYNWSTCRTGVYNAWRSFESVPAGLKAFGALHPDKPLLLTEWASAEQGGDKAAWIDDARTLMQQPGYEQFLGMSYFNKIDPTFPSCAWPITSSPAAEAAYLRLADDPFFGGGGAPPPPPPPPAAAVVMVVGAPAALTAGETAVRNRLTGLGYDVTAVDDDGFSADAVAGADLVVVSHSVVRSSVGVVLHDVAVPVWSAKPYLFDELGMTGASSGTDYGSVATTSIAVADASSPMVAGRSGTVAFYGGRDAVAWGLPAASGTVAATVSGRAVMFAYPAGATLADGTPAPACRLAFPLWADAPLGFTPDAWAMVDATAGWAVAGC